jgi:glycogen synthase
MAAVHVYTEEPAEWRALQKRCMARDFSWGAAARQYEAVFTGELWCS